MKTERISFKVSIALFRAYKWVKSVITGKKNIIIKKELIDYYAMYHLS